MGYCCIEKNIITWSHRDSNAESGEAEEGDNSVMDATFIDTLQINLSYAHGEILVSMTACKYIPTKRHCTKIFGACYGMGRSQGLEGDMLLGFQQLVDNARVGEGFKSSLGTCGHFH